MPFLHRSVRSTLAFIAIVMLPVLVLGQGKFTVNGRLKIEGGDLGDSRVVVYKDGVKERTITTGLNKFSLDLDINTSYVLSFEKNGFVAKKILFNTKAPAEAVPNGFTPFDFAVSLFKQYDDVNLVVFNQPVGIIHYDKKLGDFDYDTDYTKSIQSQLQEVLEQIEQKQKEEEVKAKADEQKAADEAKAQAKADAQAKKDAEAQAKVDEKRKADEKKAEELRLADQKKAEDQRVAEEKKAEELRLAELKKKEAPPVVEKKKEEPMVAVVEKPKEIPVPMPEPKARVELPKPVRNVLSSTANLDEDGRRSISVVTQEEESRIAMARTVVQEESRVELTIEPAERVRNEELLVESNRVTTVVSIALGDRSDEYRKVVHKWGGLFYFKNGATCSQQVFEIETSSDELAGDISKAGR